MLLPLHDLVRSRVAAALTTHFKLAAEDLPTIAMEMPPQRSLGDLAVPVAFELARRLRKAPRAIAQELAEALESIDGVARIVATANGYLNLYLDRAPLLIRGLIASPGAGRDDVGSAPTSEKIILEHTAINPNKAAHVGHLRNAVLGDTIGRLLRFQGASVEIQNYIDDTGVQVADVVVGFRELEGRSLDEVKTIAASSRFDYHCWDLYARVTEWYEADKSRLRIRAAALHDIEHGGNETAELAAFIADRIVGCHLRTMARMNVDYDLLTWEGDILRRRFWAHAFEILKNNGTMFLQTEGRLAGCWVMRIDDEPDTVSPEGGMTSSPGGAGVGAGGSPSAGGAGGPPSPGGAGLRAGGSAVVEPGDEDEPREKVIVRSDGTVTYVGKDIAYQFWKFGLLGRDFYYRPYATRLDGGILFATASEPQSLAQGVVVPRFGGAAGVYNVIDTRQAYLQKLLKQALAAMGHVREAERSVHFSYEMVALSHSTARELGYDLGEDAGRPFVEVSGRKGLGVKADDLFDRLFEKAAAEVERRNPDLEPAETRRIAGMIGTAAVRYFLVKFSRNKVIAFDIDEALSFEGESGPYLQYSAVRANNIFNKLRDREGLDESAVRERLSDLPRQALDDAEADDLWNLVLQSARLDEIVDQAVRTLEPAGLAKYAFGLAQMFNTFYQRYPILNEPRSDVRLWRAAAVSYFRQQMTQAISLMGFDVPPRM